MITYSPGEIVVLHYPGGSCRAKVESQGADLDGTPSLITNLCTVCWPAHSKPFIVWRPSAKGQAPERSDLRRIVRVEARERDAYVRAMLIKRLETTHCWSELTTPALDRICDELDLRPGYLKALAERVVADPPEALQSSSDRATP